MTSGVWLFLVVLLALVLFDGFILTGWYRQCDVIPYSQDVDIGMFIRHYDVRLIASMQLHNIPLKHLFGKVQTVL